MDDKKKMQVIERVKNMSDREVDILEIFMLGFRSGIQVIKLEMESQKASECPQQTA